MKVEIANSQLSTFNYNLDGIAYFPYLCYGTETAKGNDIVPFFFVMNTEIQQKIEGSINSQLEESEVFLVEVKVLSGNNIRVFLDADHGITIDKCTKVNRALYRHIEEAGMFPGGDFSLEVSSPGVDEPLKLHRQYIKNIGRKVEVTMTDDTKKEGKLVAVSEEDITLQEGGTKKEPLKTTNILFNQIRHTKVLVTF